MEGGVRKLCHGNLQKSLITSFVKFFSWKFLEFCYDLTLKKFLIKTTLDNFLQSTIPPMFPNFPSHPTPSNNLPTFSTILEITVTICRTMIKTKLERQIHRQERNSSGCLSSHNDDLPLGSAGFWVVIKVLFLYVFHSITISLDLAVDFLKNMFAFISMA